MKIAFEEWLRDQAISDEARGCFEESFLCYRTKAYRASLLFSYLGFLTIIQGRLLVASLPPGIPQGMWDDCRKKLSNERQWEEMTYDATQVQKPASYFSLNDDIRREIAYWRDRRNDAAHFKKRVIDYAKVEGLWSFIQSRLSLIVVIGSSQDLLTKVLDHYDATLTPPAKPVTPLITALSDTVLPEGYEAFFTELKARITGPDQARVSAQAESAFSDACLRTGSAALRAAIAAHLIKSEESLEKFLVAFPEHVGLLNNNPPALRKIWKSKFVHSKDEDHFPLIASMLRANLIPNDEITECLTSIIEEAPTSTPTAEDLPLFIQHGFLDVVEEVASRMLGDFAWANSSAKVVISLIDSRPITENLAGRIYNAFNSTYNPRELRPVLKEYFTRRQDKRQNTRLHEEDRRKPTSFHHISRLFAHPLKNLLLNPKQHKFDLFPSRDPINFRLTNSDNQS